MKKASRAGFTIVELVIVIAVVAVLAAVLIPTFSGIVDKANDSKALQEAKNAYTEYMIDHAADVGLSAYMVYQQDGRFVALKSGAAVGVYESKEEALTALIGADFDVSELKPTADGKLFTYGGEVSEPDVTPDNPANPDAPEEYTPTDWSGATAVFVGDSITEAGGIASPYHVLVGSELNMSNLRHMGISGSCISATSDYGTDKTPLINRWQNIPEADLIVIFMGTNDFGHASALGSIADGSDVSFYGALNVIISGVKAAHPDSQIVMVTPMHRICKSTGMDSADDSLPNQAGATLADYVNAIKNICDKYGLYTIDLFGEEELNPHNESVKNSYFQSDALHPNGAGHEKIAEILAEELKKIPRPERNDGNDGGNASPDEPATPESPDYTVRIGNRFGGASYATARNRACTLKNLYLKAGTIVILKNNEKYNWAISPETDADSTNEGGKYLTPAWDEGGYRVIDSDGWYGFTLAQTAEFDLGGTDPDNLLEYFVITETVEMQNDNRFAPNASTASTRLSSAINLYFPAGTVITFKTGTPATHWAISKTKTPSSSDQDYKTPGGWTSQSDFTVAEDGYYGFVLKNDNVALNPDGCDLFDFFDITGYSK